MATYGDLETMLEITLPENPTFDESTPPWKNIDSIKQPADPKSSTEIFAQKSCKDGLNRDHDSPQSSYSSPFTLSPKSSLTSDHDQNLHSRSGSASSCNSELSSLTSEESEFQSCNDFEDAIENDAGECQNYQSERKIVSRRNHDEAFPPPIPSLGRSGKPWGWLQSIRQNGRITLTKMTIQNHEFMQARRENGRLRLQFFSVAGGKINSGGPPPTIEG